MTYSNHHPNRHHLISIKKAISCAASCICAGIFLAVPCAVLAAPSPSPAETDGSEKKVMQLERMVVTAAGFEQTLMEAPASISVISNEDLAKKAFRDLSDALAEFEGISILGTANQSGGGGRDISIRGMPAGYTLILVDGKRQNSRSIRTNGDAGFEVGWMPPLEAIERIEVVRGPMSSLYGSDAMGGVVNIITKKVSSRWTGSVRAEATVQENGDAGNTYATNFYLGGPLKTDLLGLTLWGGYLRRAEDKILNGYNESRNPTVAGRLVFTPTRNHDIMLEAGTSEQESYTRGGRSVAPGTADSRQDNTRDFYSFSHTGRWAFGTSEIKAYREEVLRQSETLATGALGTANEAENTVIDVKLTLPFDRHHLTVGGQWREEQVHLPSYIRRICRDDIPAPAPGAPDYRGCPDGTPSTGAYYTSVSEKIGMKISEWSLFAEDEWRITQNFSLTGGLRMENNSEFGGHFTPRGYAVYKLGAHWVLKGGVSGGYKTPSVRSILPDYATASGGANGGGAIVIRGNPDLKPETSINTEIGIQYNHPGLRLTGGLTLFNNDFKDKLVEMEFPGLELPEYPGARIRQQANVSEARIRGLEASIRHGLTETLSIRASYTAIESEVKEDPVNPVQIGAQIASTPRQTLTGTLEWNPIPRLTAWTRALVYDRTPVTTSRTTTALPRPGYSQFDLGGNFKITDGITLFAAIYNITDKQLDYTQSNNWIDGRRFWLGANYKF
jgi:outer membrane receptor for ferrienterochelin and colicins